MSTKVDRSLTKAGGKSGQTAPFRLEAVLLEFWRILSERISGDYCVDLGFVDRGLSKRLQWLGTLWYDLELIVLCGVLSRASMLTCRTKKSWWANSTMRQCGMPVRTLPPWNMHEGRTTANFCGPASSNSSWILKEMNAQMSETRFSLCLVLPRTG